MTSLSLEGFASEVVSAEGAEKNLLSVVNRNELKRSPAVSCRLGVSLSHDRVEGVDQLALGPVGVLAFETDAEGIKQLVYVVHVTVEVVAGPAGLVPMSRQELPSCLTVVRRSFLVGEQPPGVPDLLGLVVEPHQAARLDLVIASLTLCA